MTATGLIVGAPLLYWVGKIAASELFGITPYDRLVLTGAVLMLLAVSVIAGWLPARRAMRVDSDASVAARVKLVSMRS